MMRSHVCFLAAALAVSTAVPANAEVVLQSQKYPVRVHHEPGKEVFAQTVLNAIEDAWKFQVIEQGFLPPPADSGLHGSDDFDVLIQPTPYQAYVTAVAPAADRPLGWTTQMVLDPNMPAFALPLVVSHEFHHAIQGGVCTFGNNFSEAGAVYVSGIHRKGETRNLSYFLGFNAFQQKPERSLDWQGATGDFYPYGSALFFIYLDDAAEERVELGQYKKLLDAMYEETKTATSCPYYLDTLGKDVDLNAAYAEFARWRYFVGPKADAYHFVDLPNWSGKGPKEQVESVTLDREIDPTALPLVDAEPASAPMPFGATYVRLALADPARPARLRLSFQGEPSVKWSVETLLVDGAEAPIERTSAVAADGRAEVTFSTKQASELVIAFVNLGNEQHNDDGSDWTPAPFRYSLAALKAPSLAAVSPAVLTSGEALTVELRGADFPEGVPAITFSNPAVLASKVVRVDAGLVRADLSAASGAAPGPVSVTLTWSSAEAEATLQNALSIVAPAPPPPAPAGESGGGGCTAAPRGSHDAGAWLGLLLILAAAARRLS